MCLAKPPFLASSGGKPFRSQLLVASRQHPLHFLNMGLRGRTLKHSSVCRHLPHLARDGAWIAQISSSIGACRDLLVQCRDLTRALCGKAHRCCLGIGSRHVSELLFEGCKEAACFGVAQLVCQQLLLRMAL